jgi:NAD(P)H-flavin reductase
MAENIYKPFDARIEEVIPLTADVSLFKVSPERLVGFSPGQFFMLSVWGYGEAPISVTSGADEPLSFAVRKAGLVTGALHGLTPGDRLGLRGPYGRGFPLDIAKGRDIVLMAGGLGLAPLRPLVLEFLRGRQDYGDVLLFYGAKTPRNLLYRDEFPGWEASGIKTALTVDCKDEGWQGCIGLVTTLLDETGKDLKDATAYVWPARDDRGGDGKAFPKGHTR